MYEYIIRKGSSEAHLERIINAAAEADWEPISYTVRPSGGIFLLIGMSLWADHFVLLRRRKEG
jgi:hypothetical protein